jgi:hypothetical protein
VLRVGLDEVPPRLLCTFELSDVGGEPGPRAFEKPSARFRRALPSMLGRLQRGGTGRDLVAASMPGEESTAGILDATEVLLLCSARGLQVLVACSDGCVGPLSGAGPEVSEVLV